jgi:hypothetical protein
LDDPLGGKFGVELLVDKSHSEDLVRMIERAMLLGDLRDAKLSVLLVDGNEEVVRRLGSRLASITPSLPAVGLSGKGGEFSLALGANATEVLRVGRDLITPVSRTPIPQ